MPFVNIRITRENNEPTPKQKQELIAGVTELLAKVLGKNKASTVVIIDEINTDITDLVEKASQSLGRAELSFYAPLNLNKFF